MLKSKQIYLSNLLKHIMQKVIFLTIIRKS